MSNEKVKCMSHECINQIEPGLRYCTECQKKFVMRVRASDTEAIDKVLKPKPYSKYFKSVADLQEIDIYQVCNLFEVKDDSGALHHAIKKLLLSGVRNGNKSKFQDIKEASDTLLRWLEINKE